MKSPEQVFEDRIIKALKKLREKKGLSPEDIDEKIHCDKGLIRWIEALNRPVNIPIRYVYRYAKALGYSPLVSFSKDPIEEPPAKKTRKK